MAMSQLPQLPAEPHVALVRCQTNYLGYSAPSEVRDGLEAVQKPLATLVCAAGRVLGPPFDAVLTAYTSGVSLEAPPSVARPVVINKWWPISDLLECGAFRWDGVQFQPVKYQPNAPLTGAGQPTLFAMTFRRRDIPANDCWAFVTKTDQAAIALTTALKLAHMNRLGWASSPNDRPPGVISDPEPCTKTVQHSVSTGSSMFQASNGCGQSSNWKSTDNDCGAMFINSSLGNFCQVYNEFNEKPPLQGYFYTPSSSLIKTYSVASDKPCNPTPQQQLQRSTESKVSALPLISGPFGPNYARLDRYYDGPSPADDARPTTTSWPLVHDVPPPQPAQLQALPSVPFAEYPAIAYPEYFPAYPPPPLPPPVQQPETVEVITRVVKKKHHKHPSYCDDDGTGTVGGNSPRYVLVPERALQGRECRPPLREVPASQLVYPPEFVPPNQFPRDDYLQPAYFPQYESYIPQGIPPPGLVDPQLQGPPLMVDPYADEGPYERRLPIGDPRAAGRMMMAPYDDQAYDPNLMYGSNFILKPTAGMMRRA